MMRSLLLFSSALFVATACSGVPPAGQDGLPPGVEQILPRGGIPAIFNPQFVSASSADIPDDAWILGIEVEGVPKAYSLNLLNQHEIVNDQSGGTAFAAVW